MAIVGPIGSPSRVVIKWPAGFLPEGEPSRADAQRPGKPADRVEPGLIDMLLDPSDRSEADHRFLGEILLRPAEALPAPLQSFAHGEHRQLQFLFINIVSQSSIMHERGLAINLGRPYSYGHWLLGREAGGC
jgi:hypothetical protein